MNTQSSQIPVWLLASVLQATLLHGIAETAPSLQAVSTGNQIQLSWDKPKDPWILETTDRLDSGILWWAARRAIQSDGERESVSVKPAVSPRFYRLTSVPYSNRLETVRGPIPADGSRIILPHEHVFTDLRGPTVVGYGTADVDDVIRVMNPLLVEARKQGVGLLVECTGIGVGRNVPMIQRLSQESGLDMMVPTGVYGRDHYAPPETRIMTEDELAALFVREVREGIENTGVRAGFIKIATSNTGMTAMEQKFLRAAGRAARDTGAAIASHTTSGLTARKQVEILESISPMIRFIWVHAQTEKNRNYHRDLAARGVFIEFDALGWTPAEDNGVIAAIKDLVAGGYGDRLLLSHDAGWYQPGQRNGGTQKPYTYLLNTFVPKMRNAGLDDAMIRMIIQDNPVRAFAFMSTVGRE